MQSRVTTLAAKKPALHTHAAAEPRWRRPRVDALPPHARSRPSAQNASTGHAAHAAPPVEKKPELQVQLSADVDPGGAMELLPQGIATPLRQKAPSAHGMHSPTARAMKPAWHTHSESALLPPCEKLLLGHRSAVPLPGQ